MDFRQRGAALLFMLTLLFLVTLALFVGRLSSFGLKTARDARTAAALAQAKQALIAYAVTYGDAHPGKVPGYLPCPETLPPRSMAREGSADLSCGVKNVSRMGRLPWKTLGLEPLRDGAGECLWYAVSGSYKNNPATDMLNWDTDGQFAVFASQGAAPIDGPGAPNRAAAVIFAPGPVLGRQNRAPLANDPVCGGNYAPVNYLEASARIDNTHVSLVPGAITAFVAGSAESKVNDSLLTITPREIFDAIARRSDFGTALARIASRVADCIAAYGKRNANGAGDRRLPWPAPMALTDYSTNDAYDDAAHRLFGRVPFRVADSKRETANDMIGSTLISRSNCPQPWPALDDAWYKNWKDHLFYALGAAFTPGAAPPSTCPACLSANGAGRYAAIVLFAGRRLAGQTRDGPAERASPANYLEGRNRANGAGGDADYQGGPESPAFNDRLFCIDAALKVLPCP